MRVEHIAFNVPDPNGMARWYCEHLKFTIKRKVMEEPWAHFLIDEHGTFMIEIYGNTSQPSFDFPQIAPATMHLAFVSNNLAADRERLMQAGATAVSEGIDELPGGDAMTFLRDPWGITLQLITRAKPMLD